MEFSEVIKNRYSCKKFSDKKVDKEVLEKILNCGRLAPTAKNLQEQKIYVVESKDGLELIDKVTPCRYNAQTVLVVAFNKDNVYTYPESTRNSGIEDATIVATHLLLGAYNEGIDSCWINNFNINKLRELLNLPDNEDVLMLLDLGFADKSTSPLPNHYLRKDLNEIVKFI